METNTIIFEKAFEYLSEHKRMFLITEISRRTTINRSLLSASINGTNNRYNEPSILPKKHQQSIIDFVQSLQIIPPTKELTVEQSFEYILLWQQLFNKAVLARLFQVSKITLERSLRNREMTPKLFKQGFRISEFVKSMQIDVVFTNKKQDL